jgi:hypothetical protein
MNTLKKVGSDCFADITCTSNVGATFFLLQAQFTECAFYRNLSSLSGSLENLSYA